MLGAIIGDIAGSNYEVLEVASLKKKEIDYNRRIKILDKETPLFTSESLYTDDTVLTAAIASALLNNKDYGESLKEFGLRELNLGLDKYGRSRFSKEFIEWLQGDSVGKSSCNGCAVRISPIANYFNNLDKVVEETKKATTPTHRKSYSFDMSELVSVCIYLAKKQQTKEYIINFFKLIYGYRFGYRLEDLQKNYTFTSEAIDSVPQAVYCFLISNSFEDAIRKAISIGGDSGTIAAITGSIAEAYYGIDENLIKEIEKYLPEYIINIVNKFYNETKGYEPFKNEVKDFFKEQNLYNEEFFDYIKSRTNTLENVNKEWCCCYPLVDNGIITDIRLVVPEIKTKEDLITNIRVYVKALELYKELGMEYKCKNNILDEKADEIEKIYKKNKPI